jgi:flagellar P-ring protein precursor FlgI
MLRGLVVLGLLLIGSWANAAVRIKDVADLQGVRDNQLVGYGLVVGLQGSGDTLQNSTFTQQSLESMLDRMGVNVRGSNLRTRNVAAVLVTADLPPFVGKGARIDATVSSLGDANSLMGGTLILTPLSGADGATYAVAQGPVAVSGFSAVGQAESLTQGVPTSGRIPNGATVEQEVPGGFAEINPMMLELKNPDFNTAVRIANAINEYTVQKYRIRSAEERDNRTIVLRKPAAVGSARFIADIGELTIVPDTPARVVIDARAGTVVIGEDVEISTVAVTQGNLTVRITETPNVSQPSPRSNGQTIVTPQTQVTADQQGGPIAIIGATDLRTLVNGLNRIGLKPSGIISILQAIKTAGALQADLIIQ